MKLNTLVRRSVRKIKAMYFILVLLYLYYSISSCYTSHFEYSKSKVKQ